MMLTGLDDGGSDTVSPVRLLSEHMPHAMTVSVGVWVSAGSRWEAPEDGGACHFLEHVVFRGAGPYSASALNRRMDLLGGRANAFTTKDATCFHMELLPEDLAEGLALLAAMTQEPLIRDDDVESERQVILQEIRTTRDNPADLARDLCLRACWGSHPLSRPILGTEETVGRLTPEALRRFHADSYLSANMVVAAAGPVAEAELTGAVSEAFLPAEYQGRREHQAVPEFAGDRKGAGRPLDLVHLVMAVPGVAATSDDLAAVSVIAAMLGGGFGSRLFQEIREKRGWAYRVDSTPLVYRDGGILPVYAAVPPGRAADVVGLVQDELARVAAGDFLPEEFDLARKRTVRRLAMGMETVRSRMLRLGRVGLGLGRTEAAEETARRLGAFSFEGFRALARRRLGASRMAVGAVGAASVLETIGIDPGGP